MKIDLYKEYALANNNIEIGDIVQDQICTISVDRITVAKTFSEFSECAYHGFELKKDLTPKKNRTISTVYQSNIKNIIKQTTEN
jgi:hypothetical protein